MHEHPLLDLDVFKTMEKFLDRSALNLQYTDLCVQDKRLKELFDDIPTLEELHDMELQGVKADIILVDSIKDKKLSMLKQLISTLVKGLNSNPAAIIKKIAGLVSSKHCFNFAVFID